jgi:hypothetical protein
MRSRTTVVLPLRGTAIDDILITIWIDGCQVLLFLVLRHNFNITWNIIYLMLLWISSISQSCVTKPAFGQFDTLILGSSTLWFLAAQSATALRVIFAADVQFVAAHKDFGQFDTCIPGLICFFLSLQTAALDTSSPDVYAALRSASVYAALEAAL